MAAALGFLGMRWPAGLILNPDMHCVLVCTLSIALLIQGAGRATQSQEKEASHGGGCDSMSTLTFACAFGCCTRGLSEWFGPLIVPF